MSINFNKHRESLQSTWKDVLDEKTDTNWALFGYEGQSNDLKVVSTGNGGIEEMTEDLNSGKIMYAFIKIDDPKTSLYKYVLLNWQGEGANTVRKGICAKHLRDVEKFFPGAHCTVNARNEEEVEPQLIIDKISKVGSAYSFKAPRSDTSGPTKPIGSNYQRVNPVKEINAKERDQFWLKEEQEEKKRIEEERKRKQAERQHLEEEVKKRELFQTAERDAKTNERNSKIDRIKEAEKQAEKNEIKNHEEPQQSAEGVMNVNQSDVLRQQRNRETQDLISQRTIDARSVFEKNTSAGQMKKTPEKPIRHSILKAQAQAQNNTEIKQDVPLVQNSTQPNEMLTVKLNTNTEDQQSDEEGDQFATIKRCPKDVEKKTPTTPTTPNQETVKDVMSQPENILLKKEHIEQITEQQFVDEMIYGDLVDTGIRARALYDYQAADDTEITFDPGDVITHIELVDEGWWQGLGPDGTYGLFPANYVELV